MGEARFACWIELRACLRWTRMMRESTWIQSGRALARYPATSAMTVSDPGLGSARRREAPSVSAAKANLN